MESWMVIASGEIGQKEVPGPVDNPRIVEYHRAAGIATGTDELAWCGSFLAWVFTRDHKPIPRGAAWAPNWAMWGYPCDPRPGAVAVVAPVDQKPGTASGDHVALIVSISSRSLRLLGGNQGDQVKESVFPLTGKGAYRIISARWPVPLGG